MKASPVVEPDVVTYSTLVKGFCACGDLDRALKILEDMKQDGTHKPDDIMYTSILDGCAKLNRVDTAMKIVDQMREVGVAPTNYTLSVLVKLLGRCGKVHLAFSMVEDITKAYDFRPNIQVYTCLIHVSFANRQPRKAVALLDDLVRDGL